MKRTPIPCLLVLAVLSGAGCYTILRHPGPETDLTDDTGSQRNCADCHQDADLYHLPGGFDNAWYGYYPAPWATYYSAPWWYEDFWRQPSRTGTQAPPLETGQRHLWSRDASNASAAPLPTQGDANVSAPGNTTRPADNATQKPAQDQKEREKKEKEKEKRNLWGR